MSEYMDNIHRRNFFLHYKKYIDAPLAKENEKKYFEVLDRVQAEVNKVKNVNKNLLFLCNANIGKYIFLSCFFRLPKLVSNRMMNLMNIIDIWNHNSTPDNEKLEAEETFYSEQDIREDVLCLYIDKSMLTERRAGGMVNTVMLSRSDRLNRRGESLISWVFFRGGIEDIKQNSNLVSIYENFISDKMRYSVIDLSSLNNIFGGSSSSVGKDDKSLEDIY